MSAVTAHLPARLLVVLAAIAVVASTAPAGARTPEPAGEAHERPTAGAAAERDLPAAAVDRMKVPRQGSAAWQEDGTAPGTVLVTTVDESSADRLVRDRGAHRLADRVVAVEVGAGEEYEAAREMAADSGVVAAEPDHVHEWLAEEWPNDPLYPRQWAHDLTNIEQAWELTTGQEDLKVAVLDSGMDALHADLAGNVGTQVYWERSGGGDLVRRERSAPTNNATCTQRTPAQHGTLVGGVLGAIGDNGRGVAGVAWQVTMIDVALVSAEAQTCAEGPKDSQVTAALHYVATAHPDAAAVNLSLGRPAAACPASMQTAVDAVLANGTAVVAASGNEGGFFRMQPAGCEGVIAVGAVGPDGRVAEYSGKNRYLDLVAPGGHANGNCREETCVLTTAPGDGGTDPPGGDYSAAQGTSFASPYVAGLIALLHSVRPGLRAWEAESLLEQTAVHPRGGAAHDERYGWGLVDAGAAVRLAAEGARIPPPRAHPLSRWAQAGGATEPITQAAAVSERLFGRHRAAHAVIARADDFADALAGSSLSYGVGPLLFARRSGSLPAATRAELSRVLQPGKPVYLLGGHAALDAGLESELRSLGYHPQRLAGATREATAVEVAKELDRVLGDGIWPEVLLATRGNWPDAVAAGSFGAFFGAPILLTQVAQLHPATERYLRDSAAGQLPRYVGVLAVGGGGVVTDRSIEEARRAARASYAVRLGGAARDETAVSVARVFTETLDEATFGDLQPTFAVAVNLDRSDAYAHTLSAAPLAGATASPFVPVRQVGDDGRTWVPGSAARWACGRDYDLVLAGGADLLTRAVAEELQAVLEGSAAC